MTKQEAKKLVCCAVSRYLKSGDIVQNSTPADASERDKERIEQAAHELAMELEARGR